MSILGDAIRVIGLLEVVGTFILAHNLCDYGGVLAPKYSSNDPAFWTIGLMGIINFVLILGFAKCVDAAIHYLKSHKNETKDFSNQ